MLVLLLLAGLMAYLFYSMNSKAKKLPPGPFPFPFIGNLPQLAYGMIMYGGVANLFLRWKKIYGDVHTYWMGPLPMVNICDYHLAQEAMVKKGANFADRKRLYFFEIERDGKGIGSSNGDSWLEQRRFALQTLRNFGMGKNLMEERVMLELDYRMDILDKDIEKTGLELSIHPYHMIELTVGNIINRLLFTERFIEEEEKEFFRLKGIVDELMEKSNLFDFLLTRENSRWPIMRGREERVQKPLREMKKFIRTQIENRKRAIAAGDHQLRDNGEDFVDAYLIEMQKKDKSEDFDEENLVVNLMDLWGAGQETTANALTWALCYLIQNLDVLYRLHAELDEVTGKSRSLKLSDKPNTPYLNAVILELLRTSSVVPLNMLREAKEDTLVGNYVIPKGTAISAQISSIMLNETIFEHPEKFNPSRFLENDNLDQYVVAFSMGKRACPGESLARAELYLILGNIVLRYNLAPNPKHPAGMSALNEMGTIRKPKPFEVFFSKRY